VPFRFIGEHDLLGAALATPGEQFESRGGGQAWGCDGIAALAGDRSAAF